MKQRSRDEYLSESQRLLADPDRSPEAYQRYREAIASRPESERGWLIEAWANTCTPEQLAAIRGL